MTDSHDISETNQVNRSTTPATNSDPHEIPKTIQVIKSTSPATNIDAQGIPDKIIVTKSTSSATHTNTHVIPETSLVINKGTLSTTNTETHDNSITRSIITGAGGTSHSTHSAISTGNIGTATEASGCCPARQLTYKESDTSLTSTWSLCTGNRQPPNPPAEVLGMLRTLMKPSVQNYLAAFLDFYDSPDTEQSLEWQENMSYTDMLTSAETPQQAVPFLQHTPQNQGATYEAVKLPNSTPSHPFMQPLQCPSTIQAEVLSPPQEQLRRSSKQPQELAQGSSDDFGVLVYDEVEPLTSTPRRPLKQPSTDGSGTPTLLKVQSPPQGQLRRSPRKQSQVKAEESSDDVGRVRLLIKYDVKVNAKILKQATKAALGLPNSKATFKLTGKVLTELFTPEELAASRGQGIRLKKETDFRPALDSHRLQILKEYVTAWCRKNNKGDPKEKDINDSITEQISYARKK